MSQLKPGLKRLVLFADGFDARLWVFAETCIGHFCAVSVGPRKPMPDGECPGLAVMLIGPAPIVEAMQERINEPWLRDVVRLAPPDDVEDYFPPTHDLEDK